MQTIQKINFSSIILFRDHDGDAGADYDHQDHLHHRCLGGFYDDDHHHFWEGFMIIIIMIIVWEGLRVTPAKQIELILCASSDSSFIMNMTTGLNCMMWLSNDDDDYDDTTYHDHGRSDLDKG